MKNALIVSSSPNTDGLTAACARAAADGLTAAGVRSDEIRLTEYTIGVCLQCANGWGTCLGQHRCQVIDDFQSLHERFCSAETIVFVTPVYWGEMSESMKAFTDRLRRCEATRSVDRVLTGRKVLAVAAAGGGGGGIVTCLEQIERLVSHLGMKRFDLIGVTRWTREAKLAAITGSARLLGEMMSEETT